jgi:hypothetical protein
MANPCIVALPLSGGGTMTPDNIDQSAYSLGLTGRFEEHEGSYISFCNELPLIGIGATPEDAMNSFLMCVKDYIKFSDEWGILDTVMEDYGFVAKKPSVKITTGNFSLQLPKVSTNRGQLAPV